MQYAYKIFKNHIIIGILLAMALLASFGAQLMPKRSSSTAYNELALTTSTTNTTVVEVTTIVPETTTTQSSVVETTVTTRPVSRTTTTALYSGTTLPLDTFSELDGPPHNTTTLIGCISYYESTWGKDPNVFQFTQGTWEAYGGVGSPSNASYSRQETIFWIAWEDDGPHHWAAQKGRCF
jgi:hypothetical protein